MAQLLMADEAEVHAPRALPLTTALTMAHTLTLALPYPNPGPGPYPIRCVNIKAKRARKLTLLRRQAVAIIPTLYR